jgi:hypothetical protein
MPGLRVGLHTGPVAIEESGAGPAGLTVVGDTVTRAMALQEQAAPGTILCGATTVPLVQAVVQVEAVRPASGAGAFAPGAYTVLGRRTPQQSFRASEARVVTPFVGRQRELDTLHALLAQATEGRGHVVGVVGEPGLGKSRLVTEFQHSLHGHPVTYLASGCFSYSTATPCWPSSASTAA